MNKALFLDRDGVINTRLVGQYVRTPDEFELIPDIVHILKLAKERGYQLVLITNQQGIGKGLMSTHDLTVVHDHMQQSLQSAGAPVIDAMYWCSDLDGSGSTHRKPAPGMLLDAMRDHNIEASASWFMGDSRSDAQAGYAAGVKTLLVGEFSAEDADIIVPTHSDAFRELEAVL
jgi:D-glycero-D-manno-heptose 1,7-bisphosphate phosphatase